VCGISYLADDPGQGIANYMGNNIYNIGGGAVYVNNSATNYNSAVSAPDTMKMVLKGRKICDNTINENSNPRSAHDPSCTQCNL